jgi:acetyl esterase/lipase
MPYKKIRDHFFAKMTNVWAEHDKKVLSGQTFPQNIIELLDIPYAGISYTGGCNEQTLDVYYPEDIPGPFPVIFNIHGGGFIYGDKKLNKLFCFHLAKKGFLIFNLNYRLAKNDVKILDQIQDIISALNWAGNNIDSYPAIKNKIYITGESAGGYLATMAALISKSPRLQDIFNVEKPNIDINAIGITCGFMEWTRKGIFYSALKSIVLENGYKKQPYYENLIFKNIPEITGLPPVFLSSNGDDMLNDMTFNFVELLKTKGVEHNFMFLKKNRQRKLGHVFNIFHLDWEETKNVNNAMLEFFLQF